MSQSIIEVENLSKRYRLGTIGATSFRETLQRWREAMRKDAPPVHKEDFWALRDVSFKIQPGEIVGIVGRNGAGKSTLLKLLCRITAPTSGRVTLRGRVASLLEVGTGFHPDLTGRENIFLNGALLGMSRAEIILKFDQIVAFAEVEKFIDTPVKRYSSGMYVRLAFAVAAHLEPEILIVDEVLAVGDAQFQQKCLGKMKDISSGYGRTVLFVSHNAQAVSVLCKNAILLHDGRLVDHAPVRQVLDRYFESGVHHSAETIWPFETAPTGTGLKLHSVKVCGPDGTVLYDQRLGQTVTLSIEFWCLKRMKVLPSFHLYNQNGLMIFPTAPQHIEELAEKTYEPGLYRSSCVIPAAFLNLGLYFVHAWLSRETDGHAYIHIPEAASFRVISDHTGMNANWTGTDEWPGVIRPSLPWTGERLGSLPES